VFCDLRDESVRILKAATLANIIAREKQGLADSARAEDPA
jgi:hypothetical protein